MTNDGCYLDLIHLTYNIPLLLQDAKPAMGNPINQSTVSDGWLEQLCVNAQMDG